MNQQSFVFWQYRCWVKNIKRVWSTDVGWRKKGTLLLVGGRVVSQLSETLVFWEEYRICIGTNRRQVGAEAHVEDFDNRDAIKRNRLFQLALAECRLMITDVIAVQRNMNYSSLRGESWRNSLYTCCHCALWRSGWKAFLVIKNRCNLINAMCTQQPAALLEKSLNWRSGWKSSLVIENRCNLINAMCTQQPAALLEKSLNWRSGWSSWKVSWELKIDQCSDGLLLKGVRIKIEFWLAMMRNWTLPRIFRSCVSYLFF